jgi:hypothetical protein
MVSRAFAQLAPQSACGAPPAILQSTQSNIFSEQQEQWLGEAMADDIEKGGYPNTRSTEPSPQKKRGQTLA